MNTLTRYKEIESFLFSQLPMFQRIGPKAFKTDLVNIRFLLDQLGHPEHAFKSIHIAGTNGKGSTSFFIAQWLYASGYSTGLYTSPHYKDYRERIRLDRQMISKAYVKKFVNRLIEEGILEHPFKPSFFEISVAMAFDYFRSMHPDYAVIETGLGGRLDSTNVIMPEVSVITNIGYDHMNFLGDTLPLIAAEKAGIIKEKVPVVIGCTQEETREVFLEKAREMDAPIVFADQLPRLPVLEKLARKMPGYQYENLYTAYYAMKQVLPGFEPDAKMARGFNDGVLAWGFVGRYTVLAKAPKIVLDSAHNYQGLEKLMQQVGKEKYGSLHIVLGVVSDKDLDKIWPLFPSEAQYYFCQARIPRAMNRDILMKKAANHGLKGKSYSSVRKALSAARVKADPRDLILVCGSIFTVAEVV